MFLKKYPLRRIALCNAAIGLLLIIIVIALLNAINQATWNATESTIRSLTQLSGDAVESAIQRDVQSLEAFKESLVGAGAVTPAAAIGLMRRYVATSPFSHIAVVDEHGKGYFAGGEPLNVNNDEAWHNFGKDAPISRAYFGDGGQRLFTIKRPLIINGRYKGDVFGSLALKTYYQPSAMTFFNGRAPRTCSPPGPASIFFPPGTALRKKTAPICIPCWPPRRRTRRNGSPPCAGP